MMNFLKSILRCLNKIEVHRRMVKIMCEYCIDKNKEGKVMLKYSATVAEPGPYGGSRKHTDFTVKIDSNNLVLHTSAVGNFRMINDIKDKIKINYCPMCGEKLELG
jgi:hypothetical protein